jgi:hypothetical protein
MPDISEIVNVTISVSSSALSRQGFNSLLIVGDDTNFDTGFVEHEVRSYTSFAGISEDTDILAGDVVNQAQVAFAQVPAIPTLYISRIDLGGSAAQVSELVFDADLVTGNSVEVTVNGVEVAGSPVAFNADNSTTLDDIATAIQADTLVVTAVGDTVDTVDITGATPGRTFAVTATVTGGATQANATYAITTAAIADVTSTDLSAIYNNNSAWFGYCQTFNDLGSIQAAASFMAANDRYGFFRQTSLTDFAPLGTTSACLWYTAAITATGAPLEVAIASRVLALIPGSYTAAFKTLELVTADASLTSTQESTLRDNNINQYSPVAGRNITWDGVTSNGGFIDTYIGVLYLTARIEEDVFAQMASVNKVPFTNDGVNLIVGPVQNRLNQSVVEGFLTNDPAPVATGPLVAEVSPTDKSNRLLPNVTFLATTTGAIHTVQINGTVIA